MRQHKFRCWDRKGQYFYYFQLNTMFPIVHQNEMIGKEEPQEWTGLKDKNEVDIYEGDIIKFRDKVGSIVFCGAEFSIDYANDLHNLHFYQHSHEVKVVGNIFENPELQGGG